MQAPLQNASVIGDGAMGTVCALLLANKGVGVRLFSNFPSQAEELRRDRENLRFLPGHHLPENIRITANPDEAFGDAELIVSGVPCQFIRPVWNRLVEYYPAGKPVVTISKGIEIDTLQTSTEILIDVLGELPVAALSGPSIAPEVAAGQPCAVTAASDGMPLSSFVQQAFTNEYFRVYTNTDLVGVEISGATKNVIALAAGIIDGIGAGCNAKAALLTRGLVEITRLGVAMGASAETFRGLSGVGDLVTTCISQVGRSRSAGEKIGRGMPVSDVIASTQSVIEAIPTTGAVLQLAARHDVEMPITQAVASVLSGERPPREAITDLMTRQLKHE